MKKTRFKYPSVTEVLEPYVDLSMIKPDILKAAQVRGTIVHSMCEGYAKFGMAVSVPEMYQGYLESFKKWYEADVVKVITSEERIFNDGIQLCGQLDMAVRLTGRHEAQVMDLKTPVSVYSTWKAQVSAYKWLYDQKHKMFTGMPGHVRLRKNGDYPLVTELTPEQYKEELEVFFKALTCYHHYA